MGLDMQADYGVWLEEKILAAIFFVESTYYYLKMYV